MIKIGLLLDELIVNKWQYEIIKQVESSKNMELTALIINANESKFNSHNSFFYRASQALDRKIFSVKNNLFSKVSLDYNSDNVPIYYIKGIEKRFSYRFLEEDIEKIKKIDLDIMIRFGFGILRGDILKAAKKGIWSLHHGDNRINRGGPPAFWEVANKENVTGITLQELSEDLDGGKVIKRSFIRTNTTSFYRNSNDAFWAGVELFTLALNELSHGTLEYEDKYYDLQFYSHPLYKNPNNLTSLRIFISFWKRRVFEFIREKTTSTQWHILYKFNKDTTIERSIFRYKKLLPPKGYDWADPFIVKDDNTFYLFFEEIKINSGKGHIALLKFDDKGNLINKDPIVVLKEEYHLSYPFVFKENSSYYMLPESANSNELWLYKCEKFPEKWKKYQMIFNNKQIYDASLYFHEGYWYLFGTEKLSAGGNRDQYLYLYYSKELDSENWIPHKLNPLTLDVRGARPAGKIFKHQGKLIRSGQIGAPNYGYGIQFHEIIKLSRFEYEEKIIGKIEPSWSNKNRAVHTFNHYKGFSVIDNQGEVIAKK